MNYTTNYQLPQWVKEDRIMMEDFNDMTAKVDEALGTQGETLAEHTTVIATLGNCKVITGTYTGQGWYGDEGSTSLTFSAPPVLVIIQPDDYVTSSGLTRLVLLRGGAFSFSYMDNPNSQCDVTWSGNTVTWVNYRSQAYQCNYSGGLYRYVALLADDGGQA